MENNQNPIEIITLVLYVGIIILVGWGIFRITKAVIKAIIRALAREWKKESEKENGKKRD